MKTRPKFVQVAIPHRVASLLENTKLLVGHQCIRLGDCAGLVLPDPTSNPEAHSGHKSGSGKLPQCSQEAGNPTLDHDACTGFFNSHRIYQHLSGPELPTRLPKKVSDYPANRSWPIASLIDRFVSGGVPS